jgi:hypothetical protein
MQYRIYSRRLDRWEGNRCVFGMSLQDFSCLSTMTPLGCGGTQEDYSVISPSSGLSSAPAAKEWEVPEAIVETLRGCVKEHAGDVKGYRHEARFKLNLEEDGTVHEVTMQQSTLHLDKLESCLQEALAGLSIPASALLIRSSEPFSGGESQGKDRAYQGVVQAAAPIVVIAPIIVIAAGVTLGVYILAVATEEAIEAVKRRNAVERMCYAYMYRCLGANPGNCNACFRECKRHGYWDEGKCPLSKPN